MLHDIDLRALADMETTERAFVSCYLTPPDNHDWLRRRENTVENMLEDEPDALDHFQEGMKLLWEWLDAHKVNAPAGCVFACYALDFVQGVAQIGRAHV